jgi:hypothetical protein
MILTTSDVPAAFTASAPDYANVPIFEDFAVGFPLDPFAEADFVTKNAPSHLTLFISELVGQAPSSDSAATQFAFARDHIFGDCDVLWGDPRPSPVTLPQSAPTLTAFTVYGGGSIEDLTIVEVIGYKGRYLIDLKVGSQTVASGSSGAGPAPAPSIGEVAGIVNAALARLPG